MFLVKQSKQIRNFSTALNQIKDLNLKLDNTLCIKRCLNTKSTSSPGKEFGFFQNPLNWICFDHIFIFSFW